MATEDRDKHIEIEGLTKVYNPGTPEAVPAVDDVNLTIEPGEFFTVVGPSGCGKTSVLEIIAGLRKPTEGTVRLGPDEVTGPRRDIGVVFQEFSLYPWRSVIRNVEFGLELMGIEKEERRSRAQEMLDLVGLSGFEDAHPQELSGGMQQRAALARTLSVDPEILLMDEPFGALDEQTRLRMGNELLRIWDETDKTIFFITHSLQESVLLSDRVAVMSERPGTIIDIVDIDLERPRSTDIIEDERFNEAQSRIWRLIQGDSDLTTLG